MARCQCKWSGAETLLKTHPKFRFVITSRDGKKTEVSAEQVLKGGLRFPYGNLTISLFDDSAAPVFENLKVQAGGEAGVGAAADRRVVRAVEQVRPYQTLVRGLVVVRKLEETEKNRNSPPSFGGVLPSLETAAARPDRY